MCTPCRTTRSPIGPVGCPTLHHFVARAFGIGVSGPFFGVARHHINPVPTSALFKIVGTGQSARNAIFVFGVAGFCVPVVAVWKAIAVWPFTGLFPFELAAQTLAFAFARGFSGIPRNAHPRFGFGTIGVLVIVDTVGVGFTGTQKFFTKVAHGVAGQRPKLESTF